VSEQRRIVVGISGASGAIYGVRVLEVLRQRADVETHLIVSSGAAATIVYETEYETKEVLALADVVHEERNLAASIASGTFVTSAMIVAPCSMRTLSAIANSANDNLIVRAADVHLKERRPLVLMVRETPFHLGHLRLMTEVTQAGAIVLPPVPGFYVRPTSVAEIVDQSVGKVLDVIGITDHGISHRWNGLEPGAGSGS
jgi:flavin prenyltransferase